MFADEQPYSFGSFNVVTRISAKRCPQEMRGYGGTSCMLIFQWKKNLPKASLAFIDQLEALGLAFCKEQGKYLSAPAPHLQ